MLNNPVSEKIEQFIYDPAKQDTGDLEAGTHTIVPTARPAIASAQYSSALTLDIPTGTAASIFEILRIEARLSVNIVGLGTATHVYCSVRVDVDDADHEIFNTDWTSTGAKLAAVDIHSDFKPSVLALLKDGAAHTFYFLFWADVASQATIDVVQLWEALGSCLTNWDGRTILKIKHQGMMAVNCLLQRVGTGTPYLMLSLGGVEPYLHVAEASGDYGRLMVPNCQSYNNIIAARGTVSTDLNFMYRIIVVLRSEQ